MNSNKIHKLFRKANSPETKLEELQEIFEIGDEVLYPALALNPKCDRYLLDKLSSL